jgi:hypothetical protein
MTTFLNRRHETDGASTRTMPAPSVVPTPAIDPVPGEYMLPASRRGVAVQAATALGILTALWVAVSPLFITLQHGGGLNAAGADVIAGLVAVGFGVFALASRRGFPGLQFASLVLGFWVLISSFILGAKFSIAAPMYWSNTWSGVVLMALALATLGTIRRAIR